VNNTNENDVDELLDLLGERHPPTRKFSPRERLERLACHLWGVDKVDISARVLGTRVLVVVEACNADGVYYGENVNDVNEEEAFNRLARSLLYRVQREEDYANRKILELQAATERFRKELKLRSDLLKHLDPALLEGLQVSPYQEAQTP
jgi:hypothetical protein